MSMDVKSEKQTNTQTNQPRQELLQHASTRTSSEKPSKNISSYQLNKVGAQCFSPEASLKFTDSSRSHPGHFSGFLISSIQTPQYPSAQGPYKRPILNANMPSLAFPAVPTPFNKRIIKIYAWIKKRFWPKLTSTQKKDMLPYFGRIDCSGLNKPMSNHWLYKESKKEDSSPMVKVLIHAIWGRAATRISWWDEYIEMFGHLGFPAGPAPAAFAKKRKRYSSAMLGNHRHTQMNCPDTESQNDTDTTQTASQTTETASGSSDGEEDPGVILDEILPPLSTLADIIDLLHRRLDVISEQVDCIHNGLVLTMDAFQQMHGRHWATAEYETNINGWSDSH